MHKTSANKGRSHVTRSLNGGLSSINLEIRANEWSIKEMDAGTCYLDMLTRQRRRKVNIFIIEYNRTSDKA